MQKIIPFKKEIFFKTDISEITSISLEHTLNINDSQINGNFIISGDYKIKEDDTVNTDYFFELPFTVDVDPKYDVSKATLDIDDFYYEVSNNALIVNIDVLLDNIEEERCIEEEQIIGEVDKIGETHSNNGYQSYTVYIVREGDTLENILEKYNVSKEDIEEYNDISELKLGDKVIIPC